MKKYFLFLLCCATALITKIPTTLEDRNKYCEEAFEKALYGDISYDKKIETFDELRPLLIFGVSTEIEREYLAGLRKLFLARDPQNTKNNQLLEKLLAQTLALQTIDYAHEDIKEWLEKIGLENQKQAIANNHIIALYSPHNHGYMHMKKNDNDIKLTAEPFSTKAPEKAPSMLFRFVEQNGSPLTTETEYQLQPLYTQDQAYSYPATNIQPFIIIFKKDNKNLKNIYNKDHIQLVLKDEKHPLSNAWTRLELIPEEQVHTIENNYFAQKIKNSHIDNSVQDTMNIIHGHLDLFNERITHAHKDLVMTKLKQLVAKHENLSLSEQQTLRHLCARAIQKLPSSPEKKVCKQYLATLNSTLEGQSIRFDDTIALLSDHNTYLCTKYNPNSPVEPLALYDICEKDMSPAHALQFMKITSPAHKEGIIRYGDEIMLTPLYANQEGKLTALNGTDGLARRQKEYRGSMHSYLGCAPISHATPGLQKTTFTLCAPDNIAYLQKNGSCYTVNDPCLLMHQASREYISFNKDAPILQQYNFGQQGTQLSCTKASQDDIARINDTLITQEYLTYQTQKSPGQKLAKIKKMNNLLKNHGTANSVSKLWQAFTDLFGQKTALSSQELVKLHTQLKKATPRLTSIEHNAKKELLIHSAFYTKLRLAQEQHGALRLTAYQSLVPYLKHPSINAQYKQELLSQINTLYNRKSNELTSNSDLVNLTSDEITTELDI